MRDDNYFVLRVLYCILPYELELDKLKELIRTRYPIKYGAQVLEGFVMTYGSQGCKGVSFTGVVVFRLQECKDKIGSVRDQRLGMAVDARDCKDSILANIGMSML
jgi:hypothetical protein